MEMRASDEDRQRVVAALERHTGAGRLTLDEFAQRVDVAAGARTLGELAEVTRDLPTDPPAAAPPAVAATKPEHGHELLWILAIAALTLLLLVGFMALRH